MSRNDTAERTCRTERQVRTLLSRLAGAAPETVVRRAIAATDDIEAAAAFADGTDLEALAAAVEQVEDQSLKRRGQAALASFRRFRQAAVGNEPTIPPGDTPGESHFHRARGSDLRGGDEPTDE